MFGQFARRSCGFLAAAASASSFSYCESNEDKLDRQGFDRESFDIYLTHPTKKDLSYLLEEFEKGKEVWPWIWTWRNQNGPHHVFVGTSPEVDKKIEELAKASPRNNLLVLTDDKSRRLTQDPSFYYKHRCGLVEHVTIEAIDSEDKIILLSDERVLCFDTLHIV